MSNRSAIRRMQRRLGPGLFGLALLVGAQPALAGPQVPSRTLLVRLQSEGAHAVDACAEDVFERGRSFASASRDRSDTLDRWRERHDVRDVRALLRRADGSPLALQSRRLAQQLAEGRARAMARAPARPSGSRGMRSPTRMDLLPTASALATIYSIELGAEADVGQALSELRADPHVAFAQLDHVQVLDFLPNDPFLQSSGSWGQPYADLWGLERIGATRAWDISRGEGQLVAVVDSGVDYTHPDIAANVWVNPGEDLDQNGIVDASDWNGIDDDGNGFVDDLRGYDLAGSGDASLVDATGSGSAVGGDPDPFDPIGHGTHVAGTIAAIADNGIGIAGVAPAAKILPVKVFDEDGVGRDSVAWAGVLYAIESGASVINASWSCSPECPDNPLARSVLGLARETGVVFVTSAGNQTVDVVRNEPERSDLAITVGSLDQLDGLSNFSNHGWLVDLIAPGGGDAGVGSAITGRNILSLAARVLPAVEERFRVGGDYYRLSGTSMAAPHVSGAVALLRAVRPELGVAEVRLLLRLSARDLPPQDHDFLTGAGALDLVRLLELRLPELALAFLSPSPGTTQDGGAEQLDVVVRAGGNDASRFSLARSAGLSTSDFEVLDEWSAGEGGGDGLRTFRWALADLTPGPQTLRLRAVLRSGEVVDEFTIFGLERIEPQRLSAGAFHELAPDISGQRVVWQQLADVVPRVGRIMTTRFGDAARAAEPIDVGGPADGSQMSPRTSGQGIVWREAVPGSEAEQLVGCSLVKSGDRLACRRATLASAAQTLVPIAYRGGVALWADPAQGADVLGCRWKPSGGCLARALLRQQDPNSARLLDFDGRTLVWRSTEAGGTVGYCRIRGSELACEPSVVRSRTRLALTDSAAIDGDLLVLELFNLLGSRLGYCRLDLETGSCELRFVAGTRNALAPAVSGRRIVWTESPGSEESAIVSCEVDPVDGACPRVRLTGTVYPASAPRIDRNRIVWEDLRFGPSQIVGLELPELTLVPRVVVPAGKGAATIPLGWLDCPKRDAPCALALEAGAGLSPTDLGARILQIGPRRLALSLPLRNEPLAGGGAAGTWRIRATARSGLTTTEALEVALEPSRLPRTDARPALANRPGRLESGLQTTTGDR